jgi:hypothetical protein
MPGWAFLLIEKLIGTVLRLMDVLCRIPVRLSRLGVHVLTGIRSIADRPSYAKLHYHSVGRWWLEGGLLTLDLLGLGEWYEILNDLIKFNSRPLTAEELQLAQSVFGDTIRYRRVRIDEYALLGPARYRFCYVSFYLINSWGKMHEALLVHELVHVWQYEHVGMVYISRALAAQRSKEGYNYGGVAALLRAKEAGGALLDFNYEQQAEIISDYFRIKNGRPPLWGWAGKEELYVYEYFVAQLRSGAQ